ncbi:MAG: hypothetical protein E7369_00095 [Clostridiales bacterium]|nr:hypothetical protein [Clostridiales bacterium]
MDKFGIFKLLSSFLSYYQQNFPQKNSATNAQNSNQNTTPQSFLDGISSILSPTQKDPSPSQPTKKTEKPLQSEMLKTIASHDDFVRRVNKNKPK